MKINKKNIENNLQKVRIVLELYTEQILRIRILMKRLNISSQTRLISALINAAYEEYFPNNNQESNNEQNCK
jgi:hypothetical protein